MGVNETIKKDIPPYLQTLNDCPISERRLGLWPKFCPESNNKVDELYNKALEEIQCEIFNYNRKLAKYESLGKTTEANKVVKQLSFIYNLLLWFKQLYIDIQEDFRLGKCQDFEFYKIQYNLYCVRNNTICKTDISFDKLLEIFEIEEFFNITGINFMQIESESDCRPFRIYESFTEDATTIF